MADQQSPGLLRHTLAQPAPGAGFLPVILLNNFEGGTSGTSISAGNSGGASGAAFDTVSIPSGATLAFDGTRAAHGTVSAQVALGGTSQVFAGWTSKLGRQNGQVWFRVYAYFTANPAATVTILQFRPPAADGNVNTAALKIDTGGLVSFQNAAFVTVLTSTTTIPLNQWFRIEGWATPGVGTGQLSFSIYAADSPVATETKTSAATQTLTTTIGQVLYGDLNTATTAGPFWIDDVGVSNTGPLGPVFVPPVPAWPQALTLVARGFPQQAPSPQVPQPPAPVPAAQNAVTLLQQGLPQQVAPPSSVPVPPGIQAAQSARFLQRGQPQQAPSPQVAAAPPPLPAPSQGVALLQLRLPQQVAPPSSVPVPVVPAPSQAPALLQLGLPQTAQQPAALVPVPPLPAPSQGVTLLFLGLPQQAAQAQLPILLPPPPVQQSLVLVARGTPQARHYFQAPPPPPPVPGVLTTQDAAGAALTAADASTGTLTAAAASSSLTGVTSC